MQEDVSVADSCRQQRSITPTLARAWTRRPLLVEKAPRSASISPLSISLTALHSAVSGSFSLACHREKSLRLRTRAMPASQLYPLRVCISPSYISPQGRACEFEVLPRACLIQAPVVSPWPDCQPACPPCREDTIKKGPGTNFRGLKTDASPRCSGPGIVHNNCAVLVNQSNKPALQRGTRNVLCACLASAGSPTAVAVISTPCEPGPAAP